MIRNILRLALLLALFTTPLGTALACSPRLLNRNTAADFIRRSRPFTEPYVMLVRSSEKRYLDPVSPDETRAQGEARAVESWRTSYPYRAVLMHLDLITVRARYISTRMYGSREDKSTYELDFALTPQGEALWRQIGVAVRSDAVPLARRKLVAVTGVTGAAGSHATAEFTWQWELTPAGAAMVKGMPEFERLPDEVKQLFETSAPFPPSFKTRTPLDLSGTRRGVANFQKYDDGWRLDSIEPAVTSPLNLLD